MVKKNVVSLILLLIPLMVISQNLPEMVFVKGGKFLMGSKDGYDDELPIHTVSVSDFYIGKYEITVKQYKQFCKETGHPFPQKPDKSWYEEHYKVREWIWRDDNPIVNVSWYDATEYCKWLSEKTEEKYSLPTEAQWEYAARGGRNTHNYIYSGSNKLSKIAWYDETTSERGTRSVGQLLPNELGIYDMSGNAFEWCKDVYGNYSSKSVKDPQGPKNGPYRVIRGGSWYYMEEFCRVAQRDCPKPGLRKFVYGFRVVKNIK